MGGNITVEQDKRNSNPAAMAEAAADCDLDRYISIATVPFMPAGSRRQLTALILFHHELRRIPHLASEPFLGLIRLQWWRDRLAANDRAGPDFLPDLLDIAALNRDGLYDLIDLFSSMLEMPERTGDVDASVATRTAARLQRLFAETLGVGDAGLVRRASAVGAAYSLSLSGDPRDREKAGNYLRRARAGRPPPRTAMAAFTLARLADHRLAHGVNARPPVSMPFRIMAACMQRRI
ncbi:MAG: squalene/phytoene synthase family protein [Geminicoccaceae bacterium]|nr:squalene/phytoene synthase family protein [Geminicoccaceae bacterium]